MRKRKKNAFLASGFRAGWEKWKEWENGEVGRGSEQVVTI